MIKGFTLGLLAALVLAAPATAQEIVRITVTPATAELAIDETVLFTAEATFSDGRVANISELVEWSSSNTRVARVNNVRGSKGKVTAREKGQASVSVRDPESGVTSGQSGGNALVLVLGTLQSLRVTPATRNVDVGQSRTMTALGTFTSGLERDLTEVLTWTSSNPAIVQVSNEPGKRGRIVGVAPGTVHLSVASTTGVTSTASGGDATVRVPAALLSLKINPATVRIPVGLTFSLDAEGTFNDGAVDDVSNDVTWTSSNPAVVNVSDADGSKGEVTALQAGTAVLSIVEPKSGISSTPTGGDATVTVAGALVSIVITPAKDSLPTGLSRAFSVQAILDDSSKLALSRRSVQWFSSDPAVAAASNDPKTPGVVTGVGKGTAVISAVHPGTGVHSTDAVVTDPVSGATRDGNATVTVLGHMIGIGLRPKTRDLFTGQIERFTAVALLDDGGEVRISQDVDFMSSDSAIAQVESRTGRVTGMSKGRASISVVHKPSGLSSTSSGGDAAAVVRGRVERLRIEPQNAFYLLGTKPKIRARATFDDGGSDNISSEVTWTTSDPSVAEVGNESPNRGVLLSKRVGRITVAALEPVSGISTTASGGDGTITIVDGLQRIRVEEGNQELRTGDVLQLKALGRFPNPVPEPGAPIQVEIDLGDCVEDVVETPGATGPCIEWTSSNPAVVRVDADGALTAVGLGDATVSARHRRSGIISTQSNGDAAFKVIAALTQIEITPRLVRARIGTKPRRAFQAMGVYTDGARIEVTDRVTFATSDASVAQVSNERNRHGVVVPLKAGKAAVNATEPITEVQSAQPRRIVVKAGKRRRK